jgi:hypothetical protein
MLPEITLQLAGKVGVWRERMRVVGQGSVWAAWLRHNSFGTIGLYVLPKPLITMDVLPHHTWIQVSGLIRPLRVLALLDDPRAEDASTLSPLLVHATRMTVCEPVTVAPPLELRQVRVGPGRRIAAGYLAPSCHIADLACFVPRGQSLAPVLAWNRLYGVLAQVGKRHYIRYVAIHGTGDI